MPKPNTAAEGDPDHSPVLQAFAFVIALHGLIHLSRMVTWANFGLGIEYWFAPTIFLRLSPTETLLGISLLTLIWTALAASLTWKASPINSSRLICVSAFVTAIGLVGYVSLMHLSKSKFVVMLKRGTSISEQALLVEESRYRQAQISGNRRGQEWLKEIISWRKAELKKSRTALKLMTEPTLLNPTSD